VLTFQDSVLVPYTMVHILRRRLSAIPVTNQTKPHNNPQERGSQSYWMCTYVMFTNQLLYTFAKWTTLVLLHFPIQQQDMRNKQQMIMQQTN